MPVLKDIKRERTAIGPAETVDQLRARVWELVHREKTEGLSLEEKQELDRYMLEEHEGRLRLVQEESEWQSDLRHGDGN